MPSNQPSNAWTPLSQLSDADFRRLVSKWSPKARNQMRLTRVTVGYNGPDVDSTCPTSFSAHCLFERKVHPVIGKRIYKWHAELQVFLDCRWGNSEIRFEGLDQTLGPYIGYRSTIQERFGPRRKVRDFHPLGAPRTLRWEPPLSVRAGEKLLIKRMLPFIIYYMRGHVGLGIQHGALWLRDPTNDDEAPQPELGQAKIEFDAKIKQLLSCEKPGRLTRARVKNFWPTNFQLFALPQEIILMVLDEIILAKIEEYNQASQVLIDEWTRHHQASGEWYPYDTTVWVAPLAIAQVNQFLETEAKKRFWSLAHNLKRACERATVFKAIFADRRSERRILIDHKVDKRKLLGYDGWDLFHDGRVACLCGSGAWKLADFPFKTSVKIK